MTNHTYANPKAHAWDHVGDLFWTMGRKSARPTEAEINLFLAGSTPESTVIIIGGSTKELAEAAAARAMRVIVLDFSRRMIEDLGRHMPANSAELYVYDVTEDVPPHLLGVADFVLSDRLINRFSEAEAALGFKHMLELCKPGGEVRLSVKIGLYDMDYRMIEVAKRHEKLGAVWDDENSTIDFSAARDFLDEVILPHGDIPKDVLKPWYMGRGKEKRFTDEDIVRLSKRTEIAHDYASAADFPDAPKTALYKFIRQRG